MVIERPKKILFNTLQILGILGLTFACIDYFLSETSTHPVFIVVRISGLISTGVSIWLYNKRYISHAVGVYVATGLILFSLDNFAFAESYLFLFSASINSILALVFFEAREFKKKIITGVIIWAYSITLFQIHGRFVLNHPELVQISGNEKLTVQFIFLAIITILGVGFEAYTVYIRTKQLEEQTKNLRNERDQKENILLITQSYIHDIKQPLSQISLLNQLTVLDKNPETLEHRSEQISASVDHVGELIQGALDKIKWTHGTSEEKGTMLCKEIQALQEWFAPQMKEAGLKRIQCECDALVPMDRKDLEQILRNLLSNSLKYADTNRALKVSCSWDAQAQRLVWKDNGMGVSTATLPKLGRTAVREDASIQGSGVGLTFIQKIAKKNLFELHFAHGASDGTGLEVILERSKVFAQR